MVSNEYYISSGTPQGHKGLQGLQGQESADLNPSFLSLQSLQSFMSLLPPWGSIQILLQPQLLVLLQQPHRLRQPLPPRLLLLGVLDPAHIQTAIRRGEIGEIRPRRTVGPQRLLDVTRNGIAHPFRRSHLRNGVLQGRRRLGHPRRSHLPFADHPRETLSIGRRPFTLRLPRRELLGIPVLVDGAHDAVDPPEAERLLDRVVILHPRLAGVALVVDEPDLGLTVMMGREPGSPVGAGGGVKGGHGCSLEEVIRSLTCPAKPCWKKFFRPGQ